MSVIAKSKSVIATPFCMSSLVMRNGNGSTQDSAPFNLLKISPSQYFWIWPQISNGAENQYLPWKAYRADKKAPHRCFLYSKGHTLFWRTMSTNHNFGGNIDLLVQFTCSLEYWPAHMSFTISIIEKLEGNSPKLGVPSSLTKSGGHSWGQPRALAMSSTLTSISTPSTNDERIQGRFESNVRFW